MWVDFFNYKYKCTVILARARSLPHMPYFQRVSETALLASCISVTSASAIPMCRGHPEWPTISLAASHQCVKSLQKVLRLLLGLEALNMSSAQNQIGQQGVVAAEKSISNSFIILQTSPLTCQLHKFESCIQSIAHNGVYPSSRWPAHAFWQAVEEVIETGWEENSHRCFSRGTWKASKNPPLYRTGRRVWYLHPWLRWACKRSKQK